MSRECDKIFHNTRRNADLPYLTKIHPMQTHPLPYQPFSCKQKIPTGSEAKENHFENKTKQSTMTDLIYRGNSSDLSPNAINPNPNQQVRRKSNFTEDFSSEEEPTAVKTAGISQSAENLEPNECAANAPAISVTGSKAPSSSAASTRNTVHEKPVQKPGNQKSSSNRSSSIERLKVSVLPPLKRMKNEIIEKCARRGLVRR